MFEKNQKIDFILLHSIGLLIGAFIDFFQKKLFLTLIFGAIFFSLFILKNWRKFTEHEYFGGFPNLVTVSRLILLFIIPFLESNKNIALLSFAIICLDGIDGFLARKLNQITAFGGILDMEVDAYFCLLLSLLISIKHPELSWILIGGLLRYLYKITTFIFSKSKFIEKKKKYARYVAGFYFLSFSLFFYAEYNFGIYIISLGTFLVIASFTVSFYEFFTFKK